MGEALYVSEHASDCTPEQVHTNVASGYGSCIISIQLVDTLFYTLFFVPDIALLLLLLSGVPLPSPDTALDSRKLKLP